jgi:hypothetical protein
MPRNDAAAPGHVCRGIRIHAIDIIQPPGIGISPVADMDSHQLRHDNHDVAQRLSYSSWRRHQRPVSLRPLGARSSHWYMPQRPSSPRA